MGRGARQEQSPGIRGVIILDRLAADGRVSMERYNDVIIHAERANTTAEEAILQLGLIGESELLSFVARFYRTQFVGSDRLSKAAIDRSLLEKVPRKLADRVTAFPIVWDAQNRVVSVVAADVSDDDVFRQVQFATGARDVKVYVAREAAVRAAIALHYDGDGVPFQMLLSGATTQHLEGYESDELDPQLGWGQVFEEKDGQLVRRRRAESLELEQQATMLAPQNDVDVDVDLDVDLDVEVDVEDATAQTRVSARHTYFERLSAPSQGGDLAVNPEIYLETLGVLVTLIEQLSQERGGHSMRVAQLTRQMGERIRLTEPQVQGILIAAYLHDVGVSADSHVTPFHVAVDEAKRELARRVYTAPLRLLESVSLPETAVGSLRHRFERFDGTGFPERLSGKEIPLGARILAVVESYIDLTQSKVNAVGRRLAPEDTCDLLDQHKGTAFDPAVAEWLRHVVLDDEVTSEDFSTRHRALIVDPDPEETAVLEVRFAAQGYEVTTERSIEGALRCLDAEKHDVVVSEVALSDGQGFELLEHISAGAHAQVPLLFLSSERAQSTITRGLDLGAADYMIKPASAAVVVAKATRVIAAGRAKKRGGRGVSGSLQQMGLPDVIQILSNGRKTGRLEVTTGVLSGELMFQHGAIHDARFGDLAGAEAVYEILTLTEGDFALEPDDTVVEDVIRIPTHHLLLEAMRRFDEEQR